MSIKIAKIIVPQYDNDGSSLQELVNETANRLCEQFGGATVISAIGHWKSGNGHHHREPVYIIESAAPVTEATQHLLRELVRPLLEATDQEAVFVQYADQEVEIIQRS